MAQVFGSDIDAEACSTECRHPAVMEPLLGRSLGAHGALEVAELFGTLADPSRARILHLLAISGGELCVCDLAQLVELSQSATSHQLRLLRALRLVRSRRAGRMVFYALDDRHIGTLFRQGLRHVEEAAVKPRRRLA